nr:hypothetical protein [Clostridia bacterium]
ILEDMNAHMRLGYSTGHFFRSQQGQHTGGFDLVLQQLKVGSRTISHSAANSARYCDPKFYLYVVGRLAASCGHLYPQMKGRVMCENAGAGGWTEGLSTRKYMLDAMMVGGGNIVVTAVFDPKRDNFHIPPFVYDHGINPQYPFMKPLMQYVNRLCHVLSGGVHIANALVYYPAEGDWIGDIKPLQDAVTPLALSHIDYDFAPWDLINSSAFEITDSKIHIANETFDALVIPCCDCLPMEILQKFDETAKNVPVIFAGSLPKAAETHTVFEPQSALTMNESEIPKWFKENGFTDFSADGCEDLMHLHISHGETETYLFFNLSSTESIDTAAKFPYSGDYSIYDAWNNTAINKNSVNGEVRLKIPPKGTLMLVFGAVLPQSGDSLTAGELDELDWKPIDNAVEFDVVMTSTAEDQWQKSMTIKASELHNLAPEHPRFIGTVKYTAKIFFDKEVRYIDLSSVGELAGLSVNGIDCGKLVSSPFRFNIEKARKHGENTVEITVASNCGYNKRKDNLSRYLPMPPTGLLGPILLA